VVLRESLETKECIYAYSENLKYFVKIKGEKVNVQICLSGDGVKVGSPLIFGSF